MQGYLIGALLFAVAIGIFVLENTATVSVRFLSWQSPGVSVALVALVAVLFGALLTFLVDSIRYLKLARKLRETTLKLRKAEKELAKYTSRSKPEPKKEGAEAPPDKAGSQPTSV